MTDDELQRMIEQGSEPNGDALDSAIYKAIFKNLGNTPNVVVSDNFTDAVIAKVLQKKSKQSARDLIWLGVGVVMLIVAGIAGVLLSGLKIDISVYRQFAGIGGLVFFALVFGALLNVIDKKAVTNKLESF